jgi:hypothetical protein
MIPMGCGTTGPAIHHGRLHPDFGCIAMFQQPRGMSVSPMRAGTPALHPRQSVFIRG